MAFAVPYPSGGGRLLAIEPSGGELRKAATADLMSMDYMRLLDVSGAPAEEVPVQAEEVPDPTEVVKLFEEAKGNVDVLVDVVTNLEHNFIEAKPYSAGRRPGVKREDELANNLLERIAGTHSSLARVAQRLRQGAAALQAQAEREDSFYQQLMRLQRFWKIHLNPRIIDCPFVVDLSLPDSHAAGSGAADAPAGLADAAAGGASQAPGGSPAVSSGPVTGNMYSLGSRSLLVPLAKGEDGSMRVQVELLKDRPSVADAPDKDSASLQVVVGSRRVHALLLLLHRRHLWQLVCSGLERDATAPGSTVAGAHNVLVTLAKLASQHIEHSTDPSLAALRPLMLEHLVSCRLPQPVKPPPPRPHARPLASLPLLPELAALLNQMVFREHQRHHLDLEARALPFVRLHWRPCSNNILTSAMDVYIGPSHRVLLIIRDGRTDIEGVVHRTGRQAGSGAGGSRWVRDTHMSFSRHDVPCVLRSVLQTLGFPLESLLGLQPWEQQQQHSHHGHQTHQATNHHLAQQPPQQQPPQQRYPGRAGARPTSDDAAAGPSEAPMHISHGAAGDGLGGKGAEAGAVGGAAAPGFALNGGADGSAAAEGISSPAALPLPG